MEMEDENREDCQRTDTIYVWSVFGAFFQSMLTIF
jgi:hypothetical protein